MRAAGVADCSEQRAAAAGLGKWHGAFERKDRCADAAGGNLVNHQTSGAAEAVAALLRETGTGLVIGSLTAGQAMIAEEFPLKNGERLAHCYQSHRVGEGVALSAEGVNPDIVVRVAPEDERIYYGDAFRSLQSTNQLFASPGLSFTNQASSISRAAHPFNEAELVRERREGTRWMLIYRRLREGGAR